MPWREAGLTERQAAAHLVSRFTFGARPGEIDRVVASGLEEWFERQVTATEPEPVLADQLSGVEDLELPAMEYPNRYPLLSRLLREARKAGAIPADLSPQELEGAERSALKARLIEFGRTRGYEDQHRLLDNLRTHKLLRAVYAENQLTEVLTDFWFNHFNVSIGDSPVRPYVLAYERDAIRPHVSGSFRTLLGMTARHPAMLLYLGAAQSTVLSSGTDEEFESRSASINENYARELLELHTLGIDGGYSQNDVFEVARAFTGWMVTPSKPTIRDGIARRTLYTLGIARPSATEDGFEFHQRAHDTGTKTVLGQPLAAGRGVEDGEQVLDTVATHPATASHLARKLATRFIADDPPESAVEQLAATYRATDGDLGALLRKIVYLPEFWRSQTVGAKIKSPFELAVSAVRALAAQVDQPAEIVRWIERMGQPLYGYPAPTGFPDSAEYWINPGQLLHRMNFGLALATNEVTGVGYDVPERLESPAPEALPAEVETYIRTVLPERSLDDVVALFEPTIEAIYLESGDRDSAVRQAVGLLIGSPEFQRR